MREDDVGLAARIGDKELFPYSKLTQVASAHVVAGAEFPVRLIGPVRPGPTTKELR